MSLWMRKSWSTRARRWLKIMPAELRERNPWKESTKKAVKNWVRENVGSRGEDHILWGRWQTGNAQEEGKDQKRKKTPTSNKQLKKCGEPARKEKKGDLATEVEPEEENEGRDNCAQKLTRREIKARREERGVAREAKRKRTKDNKLKKAQKVKLAKKKLEQEGLKRNKNQLIPRDWLRGGSMKLPKQGENRGGKREGKPKKGIG